jgi:hypothetical protein
MEKGSIEKSFAALDMSQVELEINATAHWLDRPPHFQSKVYDTCPNIDKNSDNLQKFAGNGGELSSEEPKKPSKRSKKKKKKKKKKKQNIWNKSKHANDSKNRDGDYMASNQAQINTGAWQQAMSQNYGPQYIYHGGSQSNYNFVGHPTSSSPYWGSVSGVQQPHGCIFHTATFQSHSYLHSFQASMAQTQNCNHQNQYVGNAPSAPYQHSAQTLPSTPTQTPLTNHEKTIAQLEYYFSAENLLKDTYLRAHADSHGYVPLRLILDFRRIKELGNTLGSLHAASQDSDRLENLLDHNGMEKIRGKDTSKHWATIASPQSTTNAYYYRVPQNLSGSATPFIPGSFSKVKLTEENSKSCQDGNARTGDQLAMSGEEPVLDSSIRTYKALEKEEGTFRNIIQVPSIAEFVEENPEQSEVTETQTIQSQIEAGSPEENIATSTNSQTVLTYAEVRY